MVKSLLIIISVFATSAVSFAGDPCEILANEYKKMEIKSPIQYVARCQKVHNGNVQNKASETLTAGSVCIAKFVNDNFPNSLPTACGLSEAPRGTIFYLFAGDGQSLSAKAEKYARPFPLVWKADMNSLHTLNSFLYTPPLRGDEAEVSYIKECINTIKENKFNCEKALLGSTFSLLEMDSGACDSENRIIAKNDGPDQHETLYDYDKKSHQLYLKETEEGKYLLPLRQTSAILDCEEVK
ncbi:MAG: hypothetical protein ACXWRE_01765 [Pseudobdellovibrionaceae bacterium]